MPSDSSGDARPLISIDLRTNWPLDWELNQIIPSFSLGKSVAGEKSYQGLCGHPQNAIEVFPRVDESLLNGHTVGRSIVGDSFRVAKPAGGECCGSKEGRRWWSGNSRQEAGLLGSRVAAGAPPDAVMSRSNMRLLVPSRSGGLGLMMKRSSSTAPRRLACRRQLEIASEGLSMKCSPFHF